MSNFLIRKRHLEEENEMIESHKRRRLEVEELQKELEEKRAEGTQNQETGDGVRCWIQFYLREIYISRSSAGTRYEGGQGFFGGSKLWGQY